MCIEKDKLFSGCKYREMPSKNIYIIFKYLLQKLRLSTNMLTNQEKYINFH